MKISVLFLTSLAALAQSTPLPAPQTDAALHARQLPNPLALLPLIAEIPQGAIYLFTSPIHLAKAFGSDAVNVGVGGVNKILDFFDKFKKKKGGKDGADPGMGPAPGRPMA
ncbi:hypothetical protein L249_3253 [Ophiocordyceps polyrhachis-furcata BCC 54312]|uniref:Uncharacterized protein n=1 Tax=Ophiocordyceps polyrhachis-furcata BCC 54312 TaxID=1330021 RepID=A0A367LRK1_9HYPO|nr:hypothetical protein L249_3253 [Ophiocordyceps polyrhachis-furcata BCC 54312]